MPHSGCIKKISIRFFGKFITIPEGASEEVIRRIELEGKEETEDKFASKKDWYNTLYLNGNLFSIILFSDLDQSMPAGSILSTFRCQDLTGFDDSFDIFYKRCNFDHDLRNYPLSRGDVINIRTEIERNLKSDWSYLFTFLIELDPL